MHSLVVNEPADVVYEHWSNARNFADFFPSVTGVTALGPDRLLWKADIGGITKRWMTTLRDDPAERVVEWEATDGTGNAGRVAIEPVDERSTQVVLDLRFCADVWNTEAHDAHGQPGWQVRQSLESYKAYAEHGETAVEGFRLEEPLRRLGAMSRTELYELAQERKLPGRSKMRKHELIDALA